MHRIPQLLLPSASRASCYANLHAGARSFNQWRAGNAYLINNVYVRSYAKGLLLFVIEWFVDGWLQQQKN